MALRALEAGHLIIILNCKRVSLQGRCCIRRAIEWRKDDNEGNYVRKEIGCDFSCGWRRFAHFMTSSLSPSSGWDNKSASAYVLY